MAYEKISIHPFKLENRKKLFKERVSKKNYDLIMSHLRLLKAGEITGKPIGESRERILIDLFSIFFKHYKKDISKITKNDLMKFKEDLLNDKILKINGSAYSSDVKEDITGILARFIECSFPDKVISFKGTHLPFRKWFIIKAKKKTPEILTEEEVIKLLNASKTIEGKFLISTLFSLGCRIEEFLNLRFEDVEEPTQNFPYYRFDFKEEYSKTDGRKIGSYWKDSTKLTSKFLASCENKEPKAQIFPKRYDAVRMFLSRLGNNVLHKKVNPHMFRKSSATYYADKLNRQELCLRYGWKFSSSMPDIYISRAGLDENMIKERVIKTDLSEIQKENKELKTKFDLMNKKLKSFEEFRKNVHEIQKDDIKLFLTQKDLSKKHRTKAKELEERLMKMKI
tara:strand:- start:11325 stop:12512 length:1188 start_codon:yes stop_codon:yes gene_type:complete